MKGATGKRAARRESLKAAKDPNKPKRPHTSFIVFLQDFRKTFKEENPSVTDVRAVAKAGGKKWKSMSTTEKAPFIAEAAKRKNDYEKLMITYNKKQMEKSMKQITRPEDDNDDDYDGDDDDDDDDDDHGGGDGGGGCPLETLISQLERELEDLELKLKEADSIREIQERRIAHLESLCNQEESLEKDLRSKLLIMGVKKNIEDVQGKDNYPCGQQLLIHNGKVLKDETTLADNKVSEEGFLVVMLSKSKSSGSGGTSSAQTSSTITPASNSTPEASSQPQASKTSTSSSVPATATGLETATVAAPANSDTYGEAASNVVTSNSVDQTIQHIMDIGGGNWDKETVTRALQAAFNNPERAIDYLYSGIPDQVEVAVPVGQLPATGNVTVAAPVSGGPNASPLNLFPQEIPSGAAGGNLGSLDFLRNNQQFQELRSMVQSNPQILQPILQELGKQNPQLLGLIQENHAEFLQLINEPVDASEGDLFDQGDGDQEMPHAISVTPEEQQAIERLEAMGFERTLVIEAFLACDRNEELAANFLLENAADYED